jgi:hypothetical protein
MATYDVSTVASQINPPQQTSLGDMLNVARGAQAYQQAQQVNPLLLQQQQATTEATQLSLANTQKQIAAGALTGLENSEAFKSGNTKAIKKELEATEKWLKTVSPNLIKEGGAVEQAHSFLDKGDFEGYKQHLANIRRQNATSSEQYQAALPQFNTNAQGTPFLTNRAAGTVTSPQTQEGGQNLTPTTPGVQNFNDYQKDLTTRVAGATQVEMRLNEAEDLMKKFKAGAGARTYVDIAQKLQAVGAPQGLVDAVAKGDLSAAQSLNKFIAQTVTASIGQMQGNPTANMMNDYLKNNPDISSDPRALERFFEFGHKQNAIPIEEQNFLLEKSRNKVLNPDTHVAEAQQHILKKFAGKETSVTSKESKNATYGKYKGRDVVSFDGGKSWEYK